MKLYGIALIGLLSLVGCEDAPKQNSFYRDYCNGTWSEQPLNKIRNEACMAALAEIKMRARDRPRKIESEKICGNPKRHNVPGYKEACE